MNGTSMFSVSRCTSISATVALSVLGLCFWAMAEPSWSELQSIPTGVSLHSIHSRSDLWGFAVGDSGVFVHTEDGGNTWEESVPDSHFTLRDIYFSDSLHGWVAGRDDYGAFQEGGLILRTTNGGTLWTAITPQHRPDTLFGVYFLDADTGWAVGVNLSPNMTELIRTNDAGETWTALGPISMLQEFRCIHMLNVHTGWAGGLLGEIASPTESGGWLWGSSQLGTSGTLTSIDFADSVHGWIAGGNEYHGQVQEWHNWVTFNDSNWVRLLTVVHEWDPSDALRYQVFNRLVPGSIVVKTLPDSVLLVEDTDYQVDYEYGDIRAVNQELDSIQVRVDFQYYPRLGAAVMMHTDNGGDTWTEQSVDHLANYLEGVDFCNNDTGWAVGDSGKILFTTDGGENWSLQESGTTQDLHDVFFVDCSHGWAVGDSGTILRYAEPTGSIRNVRLRTRQSLSSSDIEYFTVRGQKVNGSQTFRGIAIKRELRDGWSSTRRVVR